MAALRSLLAVSLIAGLAVSMLGCGEEADSSDATVAITSPESGEVVTDTRVTVRGTAEGVDAVQVGDQTAEAVGGEWSVDRQFDQGEVSVEASGGGGSDRVEFVVDSHPPELTLESPDRATYVADGESDSVSVEGSVEDGGTGVEFVSLDNDVLEVDEQGHFEKSVDLEEGLNVLEVAAVDGAGNEAAAMRGVMHGEFVPATDSIEPGIHVRVGPGAFEATERVIENYLTPERVEQYAVDNVEADQFEIRSVDFEALDVEITPDGEILTVSVSVEQMQIRGDATFGSDPIPVEVTIAEATVATEVDIAVDDNDELVVDLQESELQLDPQDFQFSVLDEDGDAQEVDEESLRSVAVTVIDRMFSNVLEGNLVDELYDPSVLERRVELLDRTIVFRVVPKSIELRGDRMFVRAAFEMPAERHERVEEVPGALARPLGDWNVAGIESDLKFRTNRTAVERIAHGAWRAGLLHQTFDAETFGSEELPVELTAGALAFAIDNRITNLAADETPAAVRLRPKLPPVVEFAAGDGEPPGGEDDRGLSGDGEPGDRFEMRLGELMLDLVLFPEDGEPIPVATVALFLKLQVGVALDGFALEFDFEPEVRSDLAAEPEIDFDDEELEDVVEGLAAAIPEVVGREMTVQGEEEIDWIGFDRPRMRVRGVEEDRLSVFTGIEPAGEF